MCGLKEEGLFRITPYFILSESFIKFDLSISYLWYRGLEFSATTSLGNGHPSPLTAPLPTSLPFIALRGKIPASSKSACLGHRVSIPMKMQQGAVPQAKES